MANESTFGSVSSLIGNSWDIALDTLRENNIVAPLVTLFNDRSDSVGRTWSTHTGGTYVTWDEATDLSAQMFYDTVAGTMTPTLWGQQFFITDRRIRADPMGVQQEAGVYLGGNAAEDIDKNLVGLFTSFTGGTVGSGSGTVTWANILLAASKIRAQKFTMPLSCVLHPAHWYYLQSASSGVPQLMVVQSIADSILGQYYQGSFSGINFFTDANITAGTAAIGGMFARPAIYLDTRQAFHIEVQRDASRGGGGYELNAGIEYAYGLMRPLAGCKIVATTS